MKKNSLTSSVRDSIYHDFIESQPAGTQIMAEKDLSERYGVSITTIRRSIDILVQSHHLIRRHGSGTYILRPTGALNIGILVPDNQYTNFYAKLACGLQQELTSQGYDSTLFVAPGDQFDLTEIKRNLPTIDALAICGYSLQQAELASLGIPYLFVGNDQCQNAPAVGVNFLGAIDSLVCHLLDQGCHQLCFLSHFDCQEDLENNIRYHAFRLTLSLRHLPFTPDMIVPAGKSFSGWMNALEHQLKQKEIDGLICSHDDMALALMPALLARGFRIPQDICVTGCNNILPIEQHPVPLTTIDFRMDFLAKETVHYISHTIFGDSPIENINVMLPLKLVVRDSSSRNHH